MFLTRTALIPLVVMVCLAVAGCGDDQAATGPQAAVTPAAWQLNTAPPNAVDVAAAKTTAKAGDTLAIRGVIGGRLSPLTEASGLIVLMDPAIPSCAANPDDHCPTPWDYCCETASTISSNAATVQLRDASGQPLSLPAGAYSELDELIVVGTVAPRPNDETLVLHASGLYLASEYKAGSASGGPSSP